MMSFLSVDQFLYSVRQQVESSFGVIRLIGEVANFSSSASGHYYLSLAGENSSVSCVAFRGTPAVQKILAQEIKSGCQIRLIGKASIYTARGQLQVIVNNIERVDKQGKLKAEYEKIKKKVVDLGWTDPEKKKPLRPFPRRFALITSPNGAAVQDFIKTLTDSCWSYDIVLVPALVQGQGAPESVATAVKTAGTLSNLDGIIVTRGGGSLEDLWCFNSEQVAEAVFLSKVPVISAVGHERDWSICDIVADIRCATPTSAAKLISAGQDEISKKLEYQGDRLRSSLENLSLKVSNLKAMDPHKIIDQVKLKIQKIKQILAANKLDVGQLQKNLKMKSQHLVRYRETLISRADFHLFKYRSRVEDSVGKLEAIDPKKVLNRGFCFLTTPDGATLKSKREFEKLKPSIEYRLNFMDGVSNEFKS